MITHNFTSRAESLEKYSDSEKTLQNMYICNRKKDSWNWYLEALVKISPVWASRTSQSRRIPFFPDAETQVSTWTTSPLKQT